MTLSSCTDPSFLDSSHAFYKPCIRDEITFLLSGPEQQYLLRALSVHSPRLICCVETNICSTTSSLSISAVSSINFVQSPFSVCIPVLNLVLFYQRHSALDCTCLPFLHDPLVDMYFLQALMVICNVQKSSWHVLAEPPNLHHNSHHPVPPLHAQVMHQTL